MKKILYIDMDNVLVDFPSLCPPKPWRRWSVSLHHKNLNRGHFLVDDHEKNGASAFEGELICFGSKEFPDWLTVTEYLFSKVKGV